MFAKKLSEIKKSHAWLPSDVAIACFLLGEVWMLISDRIVSHFSAAPHLLVAGNSYNKDWLYITITAVLLAYVIVRYKTVLRKNSRALETTSRDLETFIYKSSHDLRGPIASIKGLLELAKYDIKDPGAQEYFRKVSFTAEHLDSLLHELVEFIKLKNDELQPEEINVRSFSEKILYKIIVSRSYNMPACSLNIPHNLKFYTDPRIFGIILQCLIDNAVKHGNAGNSKTMVEISAKFIGGLLEITVNDNGCGMSETVKNNIFEMFYRGTNLSKGKGLGLYITRCLTEKLCGNIFMESELNKGTKFTLSLPPAHAQTSIETQRPRLIKRFAYSLRSLF